MIKRTIVFLALLPLAQMLLANPEVSIPFSFQFGGYVNQEVIYDSRQVITAREGDVLLYPAREILDPQGRDINDVSNLNLLALSTRLFTRITGPEAFGAQTSAHVEVDFLGTTNDKFNLLRMRHAYVTLKWEKSELLAGQTWHPMFVAACFPNVVGFGGALPYHVLSRAPMLKYTYKPGNIGLTGYIVSQSDFPLMGPQGATSIYLRNSGLPEMYGQVIWSNNALMLGTTAGYMMIRPKLQTPMGYSQQTTLGSFTGNAFARITLPQVIARVQGIYSDNPNHLVMIGGFGETDIIDPTTMERGYSNVSTMSVWGEIESRGDRIRVGLFGGYSQNLGSKEAITGASWVRGGDIANMFRVAPRVVFFSGKTTIGAEIFYDQVAYGNPDANFSFETTQKASNIRALTSIKYNF